jgi:hypothetical protein
MKTKDLPTGGSCVFRGCAQSHQREIRQLSVQLQQKILCDMAIHVAVGGIVGLNVEGILQAPSIVQEPFQPWPQLLELCI